MSVMLFVLLLFLVKVRRFLFIYIRIYAFFSGLLIRFSIVLTSISALQFQKVTFYKKYPGFTQR